MHDIKWKDRTQLFTSYWLAFGLLILLIGMFIFPSRGGYKTLVYVFFIAPCCVIFLMDIKYAIKNYFNGPVLLAMVAIIYLAFSSQWSTDPNTLKQIKYGLIICFSGYGIYYLISEHYFFFSHVSIFSVILIGIISFIWLFDFYIGNDYPLSRRFLANAKDNFGFYQPEKYGNFYNPLLLSHVLVFIFTLGLYFAAYTKNVWLCCLLSLSLGAILALIILSQTQMAWITVAAISIIHIIHKFRQKSLWLIPLIFALLLFGIWYLHYNNLKYGLSYRDEIWIESILLILEKPWFGYGIGSYPSFIFELSPTENLVLSDTHNIFLALLYYSGLFGFLLFGVTGLIILRAGLDPNNTNRIWLWQWFVFLLFIQMGDGDGLLARPSEHWFSLWIPAIFLLAQVQIWRTEKITVE